MDEDVCITITDNVTSLCHKDIGGIITFFYTNGSKYTSKNIDSYEVYSDFIIYKQYLGASRDIEIRTKVATKSLAGYCVKMGSTTTLQRLNLKKGASLGCSLVYNKA